ncbi:T9SS type A sorting domain-containing protein [Lentimicrobium sp. S6]|uniref:T9SS type A sorting domain-containing protein n=1 Tax=Lentimicrobium sp. S6 TaxID=2735872 RepID=UPI001557B176|nr:T9SS type A sorting domain-containing protein [Lentimicrobium sp. S6]NPD45391.1 T9SS type A sorting domain-containing protein [Lentimicrobium sp. S6]
MKNTFTLFALLLFSLLVIGQNNLKIDSKSHDLRAQVKKQISLVNQLNLNNASQVNKAILQRLDSVITDDYNQGQWNTEDRILYTYLDNSLLSEMLYFYWEEEWIGEEKQNYFYDENNRLSQQSLSYYNQMNSTWEEEILIDFAYGENGLVEEALIKYEDEDGIYYEKAVFTYAEDGELAELMMYEQGEEWYAYSKDTYAVNEELLQYEEYGYYWDGESWFNNFQQIGKCNTEWQQYESLSYFFDEEVNDWVTSNKTEFSYDEQGNLELEYSFAWDVEENSWIHFSTDQMAYNNDFIFEQLLLPFDNISDDASSRFINSFFHMLLNIEYSYLNMESNEIELTDKDKYYYSEQNVLNIMNNQDADLSFYPNPATDFLMIDFEDSKLIEAEIYNIHGSLIKIQTLNSGDIIQIGDIKPGVYLLKAKSENKIFTSKFIKK